MIKPLLFISFILTLAVINSAEEEDDYPFHVPFKNLSEIDKQKTVVEEYLQILYRLQYIYKKQDTQKSVCADFKRYYVFH